MSKAPAFQLYAGDFLTDTMDWSDEQVGVHIRLLCWSWANRRGIPRDSQRMSRIADGAEAAWLVIGEKWVAGPDDTWINQRLEKTRVESDAFRARQKEKSGKAVEARRQKGTKGGRTRKPTGKSPDVPVELPGDVSPDIPLEGEGEVGDNTQGKKERARKGPNPDVQAVTDYLLLRLRENDIAKSLDSTTEQNRWAAWSLLKKLEKEEPAFTPVDSVKALIDAALLDPFYRNNITTFRYLLNNCGKISANHKTNSNGTGQVRTGTADPVTAARNADEYFARKRAGTTS